MKLVRLYRYNYIDNTSLSCDIIDGNKNRRDNGCLCIHNRKGDVIEKEYNISGNKYFATPSITSHVWYNVIRDENGILKKFVYDRYNGRHIENAGSVDIGHNVIAQKEGEVHLFTIKIPGFDSQDIDIEIEKNYAIIKNDENHAVKIHYVKSEDETFPLLEARAVIDEKYSIVYGTDNFSVFFISENIREKTIFDLYNNEIRVLRVEQISDINPFLRYRVIDSSIQYDEYNEPIQIDGISTTIQNTNPLLKQYSYKAYDRQVEDYKYPGDIIYNDCITLDPELDIPIQFDREVYTFD